MSLPNFINESNTFSVVELVLIELILLVTLLELRIYLLELLSLFFSDSLHAVVSYYLKKMEK